MAKLAKPRRGRGGRGIGFHHPLRLRIGRRQLTPAAGSKQCTGFSFSPVPQLLFRSVTPLAMAAWGWLATGISAPFSVRGSRPSSAAKEYCCWVIPALSRRARPTFPGQLSATAGFRPRSTASSTSMAHSWPLFPLFSFLTLAHQLRLPRGQDWRTPSADGMEKTKAPEGNA